MPNTIRIAEIVLDGDAVKIVVNGRTISRAALPKTVTVPKSNGNGKAKSNGKAKATPATKTLHVPTPNEVRAWARDNGLPVGLKGRIKPEIVSAYLDAQSGE